MSTPYLYIRSCGSTFVWHQEDLNVLSASYNHYGSGKRLYVVPDKYSAKLIEQFKGIMQIISNLINLKF